MEHIIPLLPRNREDLCDDVLGTVNNVFGVLCSSISLVDELTTERDCKNLLKPDDHIDNARIELLNDLKQLNSYESSLSKDVKLKIQGSRSKTKDTYKMCAIKMDDLLPHNTICQNAALWMMDMEEQDLYVVKKHSHEFPKFKEIQPKKVIEPDIICLPPRQYATIGLRKLATLKHSVRIMPDYLQFVNFVVGRKHVKTIRIMNMTAGFLRYNVAPPKLKGNTKMFLTVKGRTRGGVAAGNYLTVDITFIPSNIKPIKTKLTVIVEDGNNEFINIDCFLQPPELILAASKEQYELSTKYKGCFCESLTDCLFLGNILRGNVIHFIFDIFCASKVGSFFIISWELWKDEHVEITTQNSAVMYPFIIWPAYFDSGGHIVAKAWFIAHQNIDLGPAHEIVHVLSTSGTLRTFPIAANVFEFEPQLLTIVDQEKDYDITSESDDTCDYYLDLGFCFTKNSLSKTITIKNESLLKYPYYWLLRDWRSFENCHLMLNMIKVSPKDGVLPPTSKKISEILISNVGDKPYKAICVLMLILKDVPLCSIPEHLQLLKIESNEIKVDTDIRGIKEFSRDVCGVAVCQVELSWEVDPLLVVIEPSVISLPINDISYTKMVTVDVRITHYARPGATNVKCEWFKSSLLSIGKKSFELEPMVSREETITINMNYVKKLPSVISLIVQNGEYIAELVLTAKCLLFKELEEKKNKYRANEE